MTAFEQRTATFTGNLTSGSLTLAGTIKGADGTSGKANWACPSLIQLVAAAGGDRNLRTSGREMARRLGAQPAAAPGDHRDFTFNTSKQHRHGFWEIVRSEDSLVGKIPELQTARMIPSFPNWREPDVLRPVPGSMLTLTHCGRAALRRQLDYPRGRQICARDGLLIFAELQCCGSQYDDMRAQLVNLAMRQRYRKAGFANE